MTFRPGITGSSRSAARILLSLASAVSVITLAAPSVSAGGGTELDWSADLGQVCVDLAGGISMEIATAGMYDPSGLLLEPTGTFNDPTLSLTLTSEFLSASQGFYMIGFRFVDNCDDLDPLSNVDPCFSVPTEGVFDPWIWPVVPEYLLLFFFDSESTDEQFDIVVTEADPTNGCAEDPGPDVTDPDLGEALDLLEFNFGFEHNPKFDIDIDHYRRMAAAQEEALPNTL